MKVIVLGAGVVGVTTAYYLKKAGHDVVVIERQAKAGMETSFANGGQIAAAHADPWASPATPLKALKWLGKKDAPLLFHYLRFDPALWSWCYQFLKNCTHKRTDMNTERTLRVALYSRKCLKELRKDLGLCYDQREEGILHFYRNEKEFDLAITAAQTMRKYGLDRKILSVQECLETESALSTVKNDLVGGIYSSEDESGDAHLFTQNLTEKCVEEGVEFLFNHKIEALNISDSKVLSVQTDKGKIKADSYVLCMGSYSPFLMRPHGVHLPIYPAKGYSVTLDLQQPDKAPTVSLTDDEFKLVYSRFGDRLRIAGTAELGGYSSAINERRARLILKKALELFPECCDGGNPQFWAGLRPKTPDSVPILGECKINSLFLNTGHGTLGWTMSCATAKIITDMISGREPEIDLNGLSLDRFH